MQRSYQHICIYCKQQRHIVADCINLRRKNERQEGLKPTYITSLWTNPQFWYRIKPMSRLKRPGLIIWIFINHSYEIDYFFNIK